MDLLLSAIVGVLSSIVASFVFLFFLTKFKPKIEISAKIAKKVEDGKPVYTIKVVNKSRRAAIDIKTQLQSATVLLVSGGISEGINDIRFAGADPLEISGFDKSDQKEKYAYRFTIRENLEVIWKDEQHTYLKFAIFAKDSLSGFSKVFPREYQTKRDTFEDGDFVLGPGMEIR